MGTANIPPEVQAIKVTMTVILTLTPDQQAAYSNKTGAGFVGMDIAGRLRPEALDALKQIPWLRKHASISISRPEVRLAESTEAEQ